MERFVLDADACIRRAAHIAAACMLAAMLGGCARFSVPAPDNPIQSVVLPAVEDSVIQLPLKLELRGTGLHSLLEGLPGQTGGRVRKFLNRQALKYDEGFVQQEFVQRAAAAVWEAGQTPMNLGDDFPLVLNPRAVRLVIPQQSAVSDGTVAVLELVARPKLVAGAPPAIVSHATPSISLSSETEGAGFHVALETEIPFERISRELTERQKEKSYSLGGTVHINGVRMYASGASVILEAEVAGDRQGTLYLSGMPYYDAGKRMLTVHGLDYTLATRDVLARSADWLLHSGIREKIAEQAQWPLAERLDAARELLTRALNRDINSRVSLTGSVTRIEPVAAGVTPGSLKAVFRVDGTAEFKVR